MALRRTLAKRFFYRNRDSSSSFWFHSTQNTTLPPIPSNTKLLASSDSAQTGFFKRFLHSAMMPEFLSLPVGDKLREKLKSMNIPGDRLRFDELKINPPPIGGISALDARKILRSAQLEKIRSNLSRIPANSIVYSEFVQICCDVCLNHEQGLEFSKMLDESGNVIVLGNVVFLRPDQVAKSMEKLITESIAIPNDPRRKELEEMEKTKSIIDRKARSLVRAELYCGLGFLVAQTLGFMRLTFWELTWDVMEPICFFVTSLHFALAYGFFLRTSKEPSFEGYFQRRFKVKQEKLMKVQKFDVQKYNHLCQIFYPYSSAQFQPSDFRRTESVFGSIH